MLVLGIESSCDETAASVVRNGSEVLSNIIATQYEVHRPYGGVVPELASRRHAENIHIVISEALANANITVNDLTAIAVTRGPGLLGALLVGLSAAKGMAWASGKPLIPVNHLHGHIIAASLNRPLLFPFLGLAVSGGHTSLYRVTSHTEITEISSTCDDAAGEAFDKAAKMLGLGFPGGPAIEREAQKGNSSAFNFGLPQVKADPLAFSFSGLKTAVRYAVQNHGGMEQAPICDIAAAFQTSVIKTLVAKTMLAFSQDEYREIVLSGGVACNKALRSAMKEAADAKGVPLLWPEPVYCTDNAAMIAAAGYHLYSLDPQNPAFTNFSELDALSNLRL